jgi:hypothetical protein
MPIASLSSIRRLTSSLRSFANKLVYPLLNHPLLAGLSTLAGLIGFGITIYNPLPDDPFETHVREGVAELMLAAESGFENLKLGVPEEHESKKGGDSIQGWTTFAATNTLGGECSYPQILEFDDDYSKRFTCTLVTSVPMDEARDKYRSLVAALEGLTDDNWFILEELMDSGEWIWEADWPDERLLLEAWLSEDEPDFGTVDFFFEARAWDRVQEDFDALTSELDRMIDAEEVTINVRFEPFVIVMFTERIGTHMIDLDEAKSFYAGDEQIVFEQPSQFVASLDAFKHAFRQQEYFGDATPTDRDAAEFLKIFVADIVAFGELRLPWKADINVVAAMLVFPTDLAGSHAIGVLIEHRFFNEPAAVMIVAPITTTEGKQQLGNASSQETESFLFNRKETLDPRE